MTTANWPPKMFPSEPLSRALDADTRTKLKNMVGLAYLDGESDGARSYAATAWVVKGKVP